MNRIDATRAINQEVKALPGFLYALLTGAVFGGLAWGWVANLYAVLLFGVMGACISLIPVHLDRLRLERRLEDEVTRDLLARHLEGIEIQIDNLRSDLGALSSSPPSRSYDDA